jgi:hypothetical protein
VDANRPTSLEAAAWDELIDGPVVAEPSVRCQAVSAPCGVPMRD